MVVVLHAHRYHRGANFGEIVLLLRVGGLLRFESVADESASPVATEPRNETEKIR